MVRVLVTGGAGYVGSHAAKALALAGHVPVVVDNLRTGHRWAVKWGPFVHGDIRDAALLADVMRRERIGLVMHFAALAYVGESIARPDLYWDTNVGGTLALLEAMRRAGVERIVFSSTCATYGIVERQPIGETEPQRPINPYGRSKLTVEHILADYANAFGLGAVALRYFNVAGADPEGEIGEEHHPETHLIPLALKAAAGEVACFPVFGDDYPTADGTCVRDFIHVTDLAAAHVRAMDLVSPGTSTALNLGTGRGHSVREVIRAAEEVSGRRIPVALAPRRPGDPPRLAADASLAAARLGWTPRQSTLTGMIETAWAWMAEHRAGVSLPPLALAGVRRERRSSRVGAAG